MKWVLAVLLVAAPAWAVDTCVECHSAQSDAYLSKQVKPVASDVHGRAGLSCHSCHGGDPTTGMDDPEDAKSPKTGFIGVPKPADVAALCTKCHANAKLMRDHAPRLPVDQLAKYSLSTHAASAAKNEKGAATCTACHRAHGVLPPSDPRSSVHASKIPETCGKCHADQSLMQEHHLPSDVLLEYTQSVHWQAARTRNDRGAPVCHDCHGNHATATPEPAAVSLLCGRCHTAERDALSRGPHARLPGFRTCVECHSNHRVLAATDAILSPSGMCFKCHQNPGKAQDEARALYAAFTKADADIARAAAETEPLARHAVPLEDVEEHLRAAREALLTARRLNHAGDRPAIEKSLTAAAAALSRARELLSTKRRSFETRRLGALAFFALTLCLAFTLAAKARSVWVAEEEPPDAA